MGGSYEDEPLTAGQQAALEAAADAVAAAGEALLRAADEMRIVNRVRIQWEMGTLVPSR